VVVERYKHSAVLGYVPAGRDATVSYGQLDFRFRNSFDYPIVIRSFIEGDKLSVGLWGKSPLTYNVRLTSDSKSLSTPIVEHQDTTLPPGRRVVVEPGKPGQLVVISKLVSNSGNEAAKRSIVSKNLYPAQPKVVRVGVIRQATNEVEPSQNNAAETGNNRESTPDLTANNSEKQSTTDGGVQNDAMGNNSNSVKADTSHVTESMLTIETGKTGSGVAPSTEPIPGTVSTDSEQADISQ
jgi:hypothetical protein